MADFLTFSVLLIELPQFSSIIYNGDITMQKESNDMTFCRIFGGIITGLLGIIGLIWGIVSLVLSFVFLIPLLGWANWIVMPFVTVGIVISILAGANPDTKTLGTVGIVLNSSAFVICVLRLAVGGGVV